LTNCARQLFHDAARMRLENGATDKALSLSTDKPALQNTPWPPVREQDSKDALRSAGWAGGGEGGGDGGIPGIFDGPDNQAIVTLHKSLKQTNLRHMKTREMLRQRDLELLNMEEKVLDVIQLKKQHAADELAWKHERELALQTQREELTAHMAATVQGKIAEMKIIVENDYRIRQEESELQQTLVVQREQELLDALAASEAARKEQDHEVERQRDLLQAMMTEAELLTRDVQRHVQLLVTPGGGEGVGDPTPSIDIFTQNTPIHLTSRYNARRKC